MVQPAKHIPTSEKSPDGSSHKKISNDQIQDNIAQTSCSNDPIMERVSDLDTTNIFPNLDFNVRIIFLWRIVYLENHSNLLLQ